MSERKAINKYYPPDYDPSKAEKALKKSSKQLKTRQRDVVTIRLMTPFSMKCLNCEEYIPQSRKFNGKKQLLPERYLNSIKVFRLSIRCPRCNHVISFRTDPKTSDYVMESGGSRNNGGSLQGPSAEAESETTEQTLERLVRERKAAEHAAVGGDGADRQARLEERLAQTQREQLQEQELEELLRKRRRAEAAPPDSAVASDVDEEDLEVAASAAFSARPAAPTQRTAAAAVLPRKKPRKNPLGVVVRPRR